MSAVWCAWSAVHHEMTYCFTTSDKREGFCPNSARCHFYTHTLLSLFMLELGVSREVG